VRQVGERVRCDFGSTVAGATRLVAGAGGVATKSGVRLPGKIFAATGAFAPG